MDYVDLMVPELRRRGLVPREEDDQQERQTVRQGLRQWSARQREDHQGAYDRRILNKDKQKRTEVQPAV